MPLDLSKLSAQVSGMVASLKAGMDERRKHLERAVDVLNDHAIDLEALRQKIALSKTTWLVADLVDGLNRRYEAPPLPQEFTVMATDGSHIDVDRHKSARCYLINIGSVVLRYGGSPDAALESLPGLYCNEDDLVILPPEGKGREQPVEGTLLGVKRSVEECRRLAGLAGELPPGSVALGLLDGSLILWGLEAYPDFVAEALLDKGFLKYLDEIKKLSTQRKLAIASYISFPRSTDVVNVLRLAICPYSPADCDRYCAEKTEKECDAVAGVQDRELFSNLLDEGERSALFISPSKIQKRYGEHLVYFFYLKVEEEVARVEVPGWVATDNERLNLVHALVLDQCRRGHCYPVVLSEAHEQAVVTGADRENFWQLVEESLVEEHLPTPTSAKSRSKRTRWV